MPTSMRSRIEKILQTELQPAHLEVVDESRDHVRAPGGSSETHFKIVVVSSRFQGLGKVKRHQMVYAHLTPFFSEGLHAVSQSTFTPDEWAKDPSVTQSPQCGGHK